MAVDLGEELQSKRLLSEEAQQCSNRWHSLVSCDHTATQQLAVSTHWRGRGRMIVKFRLTVHVPGFLGALVPLVALAAEALLTLVILPGAKVRQHLEGHLASPPG
jgi:hypothetical protein